VSAGLGILLEALPKVRDDHGRGDLDYWFFGTAAMRYTGGFYWQQWNEALRRVLLDSQVATSDVCAGKGSWTPGSPLGREHGRVGSTALGALCLEAYYRLEPAPWKDAAEAAPAKK
jgi:hypothetical protein